ncbi:MAG: AEC family transporter [Bacillota bacterium]|jgi:predicted permease
MDNLLIAAEVVFPLFIIIFLGYLLKRAGIIREKFALEANKLCFNVFLPCLLFNNIYSVDIHSAFDWKLLLFITVSLIALFAVIWILVTAICKNNYRRGVMIQGMYRSNFIILGLPIATNICGEQCAAVIGLLLAVALPAYNVFSIIALEVFNGKHRLETDTANSHLNFSAAKRITRQIITNPLIIATALAFVFIVINLNLPKILLQPIQSLAEIAPAFCLLILGAFLEFSSIKDHAKELFAVVLARLIIIPAVMLIIAVQAGFTGVELAALLAIFATPSATAGFTMVQIIGGDYRLSANIVLFTSFISMFTLFLFTYILINMGLF